MDARYQGGGKAKNPQMALTVEARGKKPGVIKTMPYFKKLHMLIPAIWMDRLHYDAKEHGFSTVSNLLRKVIADSPLTSIVDVNSYGEMVFYEDARRSILGSVKGITRTKVYSRKIVQ